MRITLYGKNMEISDSLREKIEKQVGKLDRYLHDDAEAQVKLQQAKGARNTVEITVFFDGNILRAEETTNDMYASIDKVLDMLVRQLRRHRTKLEKRLRTGALEMLEAAVESEEDMAEPELVRVKQFAVKPMTVEDAIAQMDMLGHNFFLFLNMDTNGACVVYKRQDGNYGLLEPTNV